MNNKYKKYILIIIINFLSILFIVALSEIAFRISLCKSCKFERIFTPSISVDKYTSALLNKKIIPMTSTGYFRPDIKGGKGMPILFMGCSFTWGDGLRANETISYKFAKQTNRTVYNRAGKGWGLDHLLYLLRSDNFYQNVDEPEYLIYVFITRHLYRIDKFKMMPVCRDFQPKYKIIKGTLIEKKPHFWHESWIIEKYMWDYRDKHNPYKNTDQMFDIMKLYFDESKTAMEKHWHKTKFVILKYPTNNDNDLYETSRWKELEDEGFIVIDANDLTQSHLWENKYKCDGWHPNSKVWDQLVPKLAKKLKIPT